MSSISDTTYNHKGYFFNTNTPTVTIFLDALGDRIRLFAKKRYGKLNRFCDVAGIRLECGCAKSPARELRGVSGVCYRPFLPVLRCRNRFWISLCKAWALSGAFLVDGGSRSVRFYRTTYTIHVAQQRVSQRTASIGVEDQSCGSDTIDAM